MAKLELSDGVIILKPFKLKDAQEHLDGDDIEQEKWLSKGKSTINTVQNWILRNQKYWEENGPIYNFSIRLAGSDEIIGMIEANIDYQKIKGLEEGDANISYGLYPKARGKGYMARAVKLINDFLQEKGVKRSVIRVNPENKESIKVALRCGYNKKGEIMGDEGEKLTVFIKQLIYNK